MRYTMLGSSGLRVSEVALGTMTFGTDWGFGGDAAQARSQVTAFAEAGGNFIDTASNYTDGTAETWVGEALEEDRDWWVVGTKYTLSTRAGDVNAAGNSRKNMRTSVERSLRRLRTDHIDVLWLHAWDGLTPVEEILRGLDDLVRAGKVLYLGISDAPVWVGAYAQGVAQVRGWSSFVGLQVPWSMADREVEREFVPMARALGMSVCAWGPLAGGLLSGKYAEGAPPATRSAPRRLKEESPARLALATRVAELARAREVTSSQFALAWIRAQGGIPLLGARTADQLRENLACVDLELEPDELAQVDQVAPLSRGFSAGFLESMTGVIHGPGLRELIDVPRYGRA